MNGKDKNKDSRSVNISGHHVSTEDLLAIAQHYHRSGDLPNAQHLYNKLLQAQPNHPDSLHFLGLLEHQLGNSNKAISLICESIHQKPGVAMVYSNLGKIYMECGQINDSIASFRNALAINPDYTVVISLLLHQLQHACQWDDVDEITDRVIQDCDRGQTPPFILLPTKSTLEQQLRCASEYARCHYGHIINMQTYSNHDGAANRKSRINIGYLSCDFYDHATAYLISELFEYHDRDHFQIFGYSFGRDDGSIARHRIVKAVDSFRDIINCSHQHAAEIIKHDQIDILIDLKGYTANSRTDILALRPASIQVNYLGYPGTMGANFIDYIIADSYVIPEEQSEHYSESIIRLPDCYQVNDSKREISSSNQSRAAHEINDDSFVFCCFNNSYKINRPIFDIWMRLLQRVAGSQLWLMEYDSSVSHRLRNEAKKRGVDSDRLVFAQKKPLPEHLARYLLADLSLDTLPVNGHTTTSDALWAGCPVVTCSGETFASRVAGSLLHCVGLPELVTTSLDEYEAVALRLARNPQQLTSVRRRLKESRLTSPLFNAKLFTGHLETAYKLMWENYRSGQNPHSMKVPHRFD